MEHDGTMFRELLWRAEHWVGIERPPPGEFHKMCDSCAYYSSKNFGSWADPDMTTGKCFRDGSPAHQTISIGYCSKWRAIAED